jgi:hypothetical protein
MKIAKYTYTAFSGAQNVIRHGYDYKMDIFLKDISYYDIELATESASAAANPSNNPMISDFNNRKDKSEEYDKFVCRRLADDIKQAVDKKNNKKSFSLKYIPPDLRNSDPNEDLNLAKYIHDIILIKDYFGIFEAEILCVWCLYNLYFFIYKGKDMPEISRMGLFLKTLENHYLFVIEFVFSTTLAFPEILTNIKNKMRELAEYKDAVLPSDFRILKNIISNKASIMIILFAFLLLFLATIGKFMKGFLLKIALFDISALIGATGISVGVCYAIAILAYFFYLPDLIRDGKAGTLKVIGYFIGYVESLYKMGPIGWVLIALLMIFHFVINIVIAVPLGMIITVLYFLFCIFAGIFYLADLTAFARIDKEIDSDLEFEINRAKEKSTEEGHSIWSNVYYVILLVIKFIYNMKHSIALIIICSIILNDIQKNASNVAVCNYIFVPVLIIAIIIFCYMSGTVYAKKIVDSFTGLNTTTSDAAPPTTATDATTTAGPSIAEGITNFTSSLNPTPLAAQNTTGNLSTLIGDASKSQSSVISGLFGKKV